MNFIIAIAGIIVVPILLMSISRLIHESRSVSDEVHFAPTEDGYEIALHRYRPSNTVEGREPVILCHGLGANRVIWDPGSFPNFARYLNRQGFDVFVLDLRGRGLSSKPGGRRNKSLKYRWTFDDYVKYDLPAAIDYVGKITHTKKINWVGHSMGGMVIYAYLQNHADGGGLKSAVAVASPGSVKRSTRNKAMAKYAAPILKLKNIPSGTIARLIAPFLYLFPAGKVGMSRRVLPFMAINGFVNMSSGELEQFRYWAKNGTFCNKDGSIIHAEGFHKIETPLMTMVGAGDSLANPSSILHVAENLQGAQHKHVFFSKKKGATTNYDHVSILLGRNSEKEVFPIIADWLKEHSSV